MKSVLRRFTAFTAACVPMFAFAGPVDINSADAPTIAEELDGVGLTKAHAIVEYRDRNGGYSEADELLNVKGIGPQILDANRTNIVLGKSK